MSTPARAVFLSYASEDVGAAQRIAEALRAAGIEVWFDQSELRGGDVWDRKINEQIHQCQLFMPVVSAHTEARDEGYFRREWGIALDRMRDMAEHKTFLVPVVIDETTERGAAVPERFRQVQWSRLANGEVTPGFVGRIAVLVGATVPSNSVDRLVPSQTHPPTPRARTRRTMWRVVGIAALAIVAATTLLVWRYARVGWMPEHGTAATTQSTVIEKSIVVLPFADMSEKHDEEYFADGMAEELIDRLTQISELRVISRTSAFQFKGKSEDVRAIGARLSVANVLEGSVRRSGDQLRIDVKLVRASDSSHRWSQRYDRRVSDVFKVQDEIAADVVLALKATLVEASSPHGQTANDAAHNLLLEGRFFMERWAAGDAEHAISAYQQAIREDPNYAVAWAELSWAQMWATPPDYDGCASAARRAVELRPDFAQAHATRGWCESMLGFDWDLGDAEFDKALALEPNNTRALYGKGRLARVLRKTDESLRYYRAVLERGPVNPFVLQGLVTSLITGGRPADATQVARRALDFSPNAQWGHWYLASALMWNNELEAALKEIALEPVESLRFSCVALTEQARRNPQASDAALRALLTTNDSLKPYVIAAVCAARGDSKEAINWLERTRLLRSGWFGEFSADPAFKAIRADPEYVAYLRRMKLQ